MNVVKSFKGTLVFQAVGDEVKVIIMHKFHSVRMQMRVNVVMDFCIGQLEGGIDDKDVGDSIRQIQSFIGVGPCMDPRIKGFTFCSQPFMSHSFLTSSINAGKQQRHLNTIKSIPIPHLSVL